MSNVPNERGSRDRFRTGALVSLLACVVTLSVWSVSGRAVAEALPESHSAVIFNSGELQIGPNAQGRVDLTDVVRVSGNQRNLIMFLDARLNLPTGEAWGDHALRIQVNDKTLTPEHGPLNRLQYMLDHAQSPRRSAILFDPKSQCWFLRKDSNFTPYDSGIPGDPYNRTAQLSHANLESGFRNSHYRYVFSLSPFVAEKALKIRLQNLNADYPVTFSLSVSSSAYPKIFYQSSPRDMIFPWTLPNADQVVSSPGMFGRGTASEYVTLVLSAAPGARTARYRVFVDDLVGDGATIPSSSVGVRMLRYTDMQPSSTIEYRDFRAQAPYPDQIVSSKLWALDQFTAGSLWLVIRIPPNARPGLYQGAVNLVDDDAGPIRIPLSLQVLPFKLMRLSDGYPVRPELLPSPYDRMILSRLPKRSTAGLRDVNSMTKTPSIAWVMLNEITTDHRVFKTVEEYLSQGLAPDQVAQRLNELLPSRMRDLWGRLPSHELDRRRALLIDQILKLAQ